MCKFAVAASALVLASSLSLANTADVGISGEQLKPCSDDWNQWIEEKVGTQDKDGHGPDIGSQEWQQTIQFRLKLNAKQVSRLGSEKWCNEIDAMVRLDQKPRNY